jgi:hypothetical protein
MSLVSTAALQVVASSQQAMTIPLTERWELQYCHYTFPERSTKK